MKPTQLNKPGDQGFSMPEVLISAFIMAMVVSNSAQLFVRSGQTLGQASLRDALQARIAQDLEELRRKTWRWRCESGTGCTGNADDADKPVAYQTSRIDDAAISALRTACGFDSNGNRIAQSVAQLMQQEQATDFPAGPTALPWVTHSSTTPPAGSEGITIQRTIKVTPGDANQLEVHYATTTTSTIQTSFYATLTPEALAWCP